MAKHKQLPYEVRIPILIKMLFEEAVESNQGEDARLFSALGAIYTHSTENRKILRSLLEKFAYKIILSDSELAKTVPEEIREIIAKIAEKD